MVKLVEQHALNGVFPYLDNLTICGKDQEDHETWKEEEDLEIFLEAAKCKNVCYNDDKSIFSTRCLPLLGHLIEEGNIRPDPERLRPLRDLPIPYDSKSLKRSLGLFSYYSQ
jgi:hypothetical protein